jgi:hypothetical protein
VADSTKDPGLKERLREIAVEGFDIALSNYAYDLHAIYWPADHVSSAARIGHVKNPSSFRTGRLSISGACQVLPPI